MTKQAVVNILTEVRKLKEKSSLTVVDSHIHPLDVMGVVHYSETRSNCPDQDYLQSGILEKFNYNKIEKLGSRAYFKLYPRGIEKIIGKTYQHVNADRMIKEMETSLTDKGVLLSLDPWAPTETVGKKYSHDSRFLILGSIDVNKIDVSEIEKKILSYIKSYHIVGLKFHPNLQNFKPQPSHNNPLVAERLHKIYNVATKNNLYLLFHGGTTNFTKKINKSYEVVGRSRHNALLKNFVNKDGTSELFSYGMPIVIAHIGHYGMVNIDYSLVSDICKQYSNVFFDTSGVSCHTISKTLTVIPSARLIFGSDALYNRIAYNIAFLYNAVMGSDVIKKKETTLTNILGSNFYNHILK